jgi:hypothetical protein
MSARTTTKKAGLSAGLKKPHDQLEVEPNRELGNAVTAVVP